MKIQIDGVDYDLDVQAAKRAGCLEKLKLDDVESEQIVLSFAISANEILWEKPWSDRQLDFIRLYKSESEAKFKTLGLLFRATKIALKSS